MKEPKHVARAKEKQYIEWIGKQRKERDCKYDYRGKRERAT